MLSKLFFSKSIFKQFSPQVPLLRAFASTKNKAIIDKDSQLTISEPKVVPRKRYIYSENDGLKEVSKNDRSHPIDIKLREAELKKKREEEKAEEKSDTERLSKRMSRLGVTSRRQAEKLIGQGIVKVNGKVVLSNVPVSETDEITIFTNHGEKIPVKESSRIWIFNKPKNYICTHSDPQKRKTIFEYLRSNGFDEDKHIISVGRLDFNSEGLILLTNDGELSSMLENPASNIDRMYRVRIFGRFDETKLQKIRAGVTINGIKYGPYWCEVEKRQTRNTWLRIKLNTGKNREIRRVMTKFSLRVNRLQRIRYGPYSIGDLSVGEWREVQIEAEIKRKIYLDMRKKLNEKNELIAETEKAKLITGGAVDNTLKIGSNKREKTQQLNEPKKEGVKLLGGPRARFIVKKFSDRLNVHKE